MQFVAARPAHLQVVRVPSHGVQTVTTVCRSTLSGHQFQHRFAHAAASARYQPHGQAHKQTFQPNSRYARNTNTYEDYNRPRHTQNNNNHSFRPNNRNQSLQSMQQTQLTEIEEEEEVKEPKRKVLIPKNVSAKQLSNLIKVKTVEVLKTLIKLGERPTSSLDALDDDLVELLANEHNVIVLRPGESKEDERRTSVPTNPEVYGALPTRAPIVAIMGHINHGKTSLLDAFRGSKIVDTEAGGITQKMGAFEAKLASGNTITFLDTPGHQAFSAMRARGTQVVDMAILVVAGDEGVQEQTIEAIKQIQQANLPFIVAMNKKDKPKFDSHRVALQLLPYGINLETVGGDTPVVDISAMTGEGLDALGDTVMLLAEEMELRASPEGRGEAVVVESHMKPGLGYAATIIARWGTLRVGDVFVVGTAWGKVRLLRDASGKERESVGPSTPVEVFGFKSLPSPGEDLLVVSTEKRARQVAEYRASVRSQTDPQMLEQIAKRTEEQKKKKQEEMQRYIATLEGRAGELPKPEEENKEEEKKQEVRFIIKADIAGSVEAIENGLKSLPQDEIGVRIISKGVGAVTESDVTTADFAKAVVVAFNVKIPGIYADMLQSKKVQVFTGNIIYSIFDQVKDHMSKLLPPRIEIDVVGEALVQQVYKIQLKKNMYLTVAGCRVVRGSIARNATIRVLRGEEVISESNKVVSLKHVKDPIKEARMDTEFGIQLEKFQDFQEGDELQAIRVREIPRRLGEAYSVVTNKKAKESGRKKEKGGRE